MRVEFLNLLQCPNCGGKLAVKSAGDTSSSGEIEYGLLVCDCHEYPVVAGIPIFKPEGRVSAMRQTADSVLNIGPKVEELIALIRQGHHEQALMRLLVIPDRYTSALLALSDSAPRRARKWASKLGNFFWARQERKEREYLISGKEKTTGLEMIRFFYQASLRAEVYNYFSCRFGQPRHLAALSLASLFPECDKPILDLACGFGHLTHYWLKSHPSQKVVGIDRNFFQLYVAKNWVAPGGEFVCAEADFRLPFAANGFSGVFCSDAFHCFLRRVVCAEEMKRVTDESGLIVLARVGNRQVEPREGYELTAEQYGALFEGLATRVMSEEDLLAGYLKRVGPQLREPASISALAKEKWLSLVVAKDPSKLRDYGQFDSWPHSAGRLKLNPLYQQTNDNASGEINLSLQFPSTWYEFENSDCLRYMPKNARLGADVMKKLETSVLDEQIATLISQCVLVGMPDRYS